MNFKDKVSNIIENKKSVSLRFLNSKEQTYLTKSRFVRLDGGYQEAERKRAYFFDNDEDNIICLKIIYKDKYLTLTHQNILGTLLSLGITHDSIGDILPKQGLVFITKEISREVMQSFTTINKVAIHLVEYTNTTIHKEQSFQDYRTTVDSLRLDLVVSKICNISRKEATLLITKELVKLNHHVITKLTTVVKEKDTLSIRKFGRFQLSDTSKRSKKGKIVLNYSKYI